MNNFISFLDLLTIKLELSENTQNLKNLPHGFDKLSKPRNHEEDFFKLCVLLKKSEL